MIDANGSKLKIGYIVRTLGPHGRTYQIIGTKKKKKKKRQLKLHPTDGYGIVEWRYYNNVIKLEIEELV